MNTQALLLKDGKLIEVDGAIEVVTKLIKSGGRWFYPEHGGRFLQFIVDSYLIEKYH